MPHKPGVYAAFALSAFRSEAVPTHSNPLVYLLTLAVKER